MHHYGQRWTVILNIDQADYASHQAIAKSRRPPSPHYHLCGCLRSVLSGTTMVSIMASSQSRILRMSSPACLQSP
jgi:hypothetical protein